MLKFRLVGTVVLCDEILLDVINMVIDEYITNSFGRSVHMDISFVVGFQLDDFDDTIVTPNPQRVVMESE